MSLAEMDTLRSYSFRVTAKNLICPPTLSKATQANVTAVQWLGLNMKHAQDLVGIFGGVSQWTPSRSLGES